MPNQYKYPITFHEERKNNLYDGSFCLPERERPIAKIRYYYHKSTICILQFCTINWDTFSEEYILMQDLAREIWAMSLQKEYYPWIGIECLRIFTRKMLQKWSQIELFSVPNTIGFYRKACNTILRSWEIVEWKQWYGNAMVKFIPSRILGSRLFIHPFFYDFLYKFTLTLK
jgi:hypothetical protein